MTDTLAHDTHAAIDDHGDHAHETTTGLSNEKLGMWLFLGSECLMFGGLISTYLLYKNRPGGITSVRGIEIASSSKKVSELFNIPFTSLTTFLLLASSLTMVLAVSTSARGEMQKMRIWLGATAGLGGLFIGGQVFEFVNFVREGMGYTTNVSSSAFFTMTGFHGVHVTLGILMLMMLLGLSLGGRLPASKAESVEIVGLYWHFVDVVWIVIFAVVYLIK
jgi:heme/copper-type cytochrome/quinol oxidase subunit 3